MVEYNKRMLTQKLQKKMTTVLKKPENSPETTLSKPIANKNKSVTAIMSWLNLLEPVKFLDQFN